ncbi:MAG TPA: transglutaminase domain-containing protein [Chloroflexi bacterium]|nr:transglutaminase domain-containing protein [Chloroflexota bacterium]
MAQLTQPGASSSTATRRFHYRESVYFQDGHWLNAILTALLYLILAAALDAAGHVQSLAVVIPITVGAYLLGLLMSFSRFDGFFALSHSMFVGLAWILYSMARTVPASQIEPFLANASVSELQARVYFVLLRLLDWVDAALSRSASADNYVFIFEICFLVWWLTYLGVWSIFRYGYTWRAVVPAGVVLLINTYYAPRSTVGFLLAFVLVGLVLLVRTNLSEQQLRWREQRIYFQPDIVWDFLRNGVLFAALLVMVAWVLPGLGRNPQMRALLTPINSTWESTAENVQRLYQGLNRQPAEVTSTFGNSLTLGGERNVTDSLVFQAQAARARYWRAVVFDTYEAGRWFNTAEEVQRFAPGEIAPIASWRARTAISQTITLLAPVGTMLFGMPDVAQATVQLEAQVRTQAGATPIPAAGAPAEALPVEFTMLRTNRELVNGDRYVLVSAATDATVRDLENASQNYPPEILDRFVQLPEDFPASVAELARQLTVDATTPYAKAKAIETYLRTIPYNDAIPAPPAGRDPLEYFLFDLQEGYCDYYATAMAMMLRVVGVPARTASGYAEGTFDEESGAYFVTERDAHTWVEVFFPEYGWIEFEPTAGESPLERPTGEDAAQVTTNQQPTEPTPEAGAPGAQPTPPPGQNELPPQFTGEELLEGQENATANSPLMAWWLVLMALAVVMPIGALLIWRVRSNGPTLFTADLPLQVYERLERWSQRLGLPIRASHTPHEHARTLSSALPEAEPYVRTVTDSYVRYRFSGAVPVVETAAQPPALWQTWRQLERLFWKAWRRAWVQRLQRKAVDPHTLAPPNEKK